MYTAEFAYHRPTSLDQALALLQANPDAKLLAGGHSLIPSMKLRLATPSALIDLAHLSELKGITAENGWLRIGAGVTYAEIASSSLVQQHVPVLAEVAPLIGDPMVRHKGTLGGSLAHADPAADYPASMLALGAQIHLLGPNGSRRVAADDFFTGLFETALNPGEILTAIEVPALSRAAYEKFAHPASRYAIVGVAAAIPQPGVVRVALTGAGDHAQRLTGLEQALAGQELSSANIASACQNLISPDQLMGDHFASAEYRAHLVDVMAQKAVLRAAGR
jgi:carbon-monoxide dehydrogenase medium subunit